MRFTATIVALFLALSTTANAEIKEKGAYLGGSIGALAYDASGDIGSADTDGDEEVSLGLYGGYKFMQYFALEGRYNDLTSQKFKVGDTQVAKADFSAVTLNAVGLLPLGSSNWELMGQAGLGFGYYSFEPANQERFTGNEPTFTLGAGVRWTPTPLITMQLAADTYRFSAKENNESITNKFLLAKFGLQFNF